MAPAIEYILSHSTQISNFEFFGAVESHWGA